MADFSDGVLALISSGGGFALVQFGSLLPSRKDFVKEATFRLEASAERLASSHMFLVKECLENTLSNGVEGFDNLIRGDGRTGRDFFAEYAKILMNETRVNRRLLFFRRLFALSHGLLFTSLLGLLFSGFAILGFSVSFSGLGYFVWALLVTEVVCVALLYWASSRVEVL